MSFNNLDLQTLSRIQGSLKWFPLVTENEHNKLPKQIRSIMDKYPVRIHINSLWGQMDSSGSTSMIYLLKMVENSRACYITLLYSLLPFDQLEMYGKGIADSSVTSRSKVNILDNNNDHPDQYIVASRTSYIDSTKMELDNIIYSFKQDKIILQVSNVQTAINFQTGKPNRFSNQFVELINKFEKDSVNSWKFGLGLKQANWKSNL